MFYKMSSVAITLALAYALMVHLKTGKVGTDDPAFSAEKTDNPNGYWFLIGLNVFLIIVFAGVSISSFIRY